MLTTKQLSDRLAEIGLDVTTTHLLLQARNRKIVPAKVEGQWDWSGCWDDVVAWATSLKTKRSIRAAGGDAKTHLFSPLTATPLDLLPASIEMNAWVHHEWAQKQNWQLLKMRKRIDPWEFPDYSGDWQYIGGLLRLVKEHRCILHASTADEPVHVCRRALLCRHLHRGESICG